MYCNSPRSAASHHVRNAGPHWRWTCNWIAVKTVKHYWKADCLQALVHVCRCTAS